MNFVRPKKKLGQHFLKDQNIARKIVDNLEANCSNVLEIGPGMGVLTRFLLERSELNVHAIEIDCESVEFLKQEFPELRNHLYQEDFLKYDVTKLFNDKFNIIGNFPYNISSQIFFMVLQYRERIPEIVCMIQKEVAERISSAPSSKTYGILSVLLQTFYNIEYLFTVSENVFSPPPKVKSAVVRLKRNERNELSCDEKLFFRIVKTAFNQRRKMIRNSLKEFIGGIPAEYLEKRPEQLSVSDFLILTSKIEERKNSDYAL